MIINGFSRTGSPSISLTAANAPFMELKHVCLKPFGFCKFPLSPLCTHFT